MSCKTDGRSVLPAIPVLLILVELSSLSSAANLIWLGLPARGSVEGVNRDLGIVPDSASQMLWKSTTQRWSKRIVAEGSFLDDHRYGQRSSEAGIGRQHSLESSDWKMKHNSHTHQSRTRMVTRAVSPVTVFLGHCEEVEKEASYGVGSILVNGMQEHETRGVAAMAKKQSWG